MNKDVFISHTSEDKKSIVEPLVKVLKENDIHCWYDKEDIGWGDSIVGKINEGLKTSKYVLVVLSETFIDKDWTKAELNSMLNMEISNEEKKVLPMIVGDESVVISKLPLLRDKKYIVWNNNPTMIVDELKKILEKTTPSTTQVVDSPFTIPMPKRRKNITQLDKDRFTKKIYSGIVDYFEQGLNQLKQHDNRVEIDLEKITPSKFVATVYLDGEIESKCKIWMGGILDSSMISYSNVQGYMDINNDNSCNDWLCVEEDDEGLFMKGSGMNFIVNKKEKIRDGKDAGEYFWKIFIQYL